MKSALLHYPYDEVFKNLRRVCKRKHFRIQEINELNGEMKAVKGWRILGSKSELHLKVEKQSQLITKVDVKVMIDGIKKYGTESPKAEEKFIETIYKYF